MSNLNPGGKRDTPMSGRVFGAEQIRRVCVQRLKDRDHAAIARTSIATGNRNYRYVPRSSADVGRAVPHEHKRELARRSRQQVARA